MTTKQKTIAMCYVGKVDGGVLCLLCGNPESFTPHALPPYKQSECCQCKRPVVAVFDWLMQRWARTAGEVSAAAVLTVGELREVIAHLPAHSKVMFRDLTFDLIAARSCVSGVAVAGKGRHHRHIVGPYPVEWAPRVVGEKSESEVIEVLVIGSDVQSWAEAAKRGGYPQMVPGRVYVEAPHRQP